MTTTRPAEISKTRETSAPTLAEMEGLTAADAYAIADFGWTLLEQGRIADATIVFEALTASNPLHAYFQTLLGVAHQRIGRTADALDAFACALSLDPNESGALVNRAELLIRERRSESIEEIVNLLERALELDPDFKRPETRRARALVEALGTIESLES